ncbi:MAG: BlaI/MecI/CopY family transcriptional regulator [Thermoguttaceae bacterium]
MAELTPSGREMDILRVLWELGPASVRDVCRRMCPNNELAFNTVQTLLRIMDHKGLVSHKKQGRTFIYTPRYSRDRATSSFVAKVFDGAIDQFVLSMISTTNLDHEELKQIEKIVADARRRKKRQDQKKKEH